MTRSAFLVDSGAGSGSEMRVQGLPLGTPADPVVISGHPTADPVLVANYFSQPLLTQQQGPVRLEESGYKQRDSVKIYDIYVQEGVPVDLLFAVLNNHAFEGFGSDLPVYVIWRVVGGDPGGTPDPTLRVTYVTDWDFLLNIQEQHTLNLSTGEGGFALSHPFGFPAGIHPQIQFHFVSSPQAPPARAHRIRIAIIAPWPHT